jgi:hypothetical protein
MGHAIWKQKVEKDQKRHRPVKDTLRNGEGNLSGGRHLLPFIKRLDRLWRNYAEPRPALQAGVPFMAEI